MTSIMTQPALHLWEAFGVELEYMIVDAVTLDVRPITDKVLYEVAGEYVAEVEMGEISWSNELALHVIELKTNGPRPGWNRWCKLFQEQVCRLNTILQPHGRLAAADRDAPLDGPRPRTEALAARVQSDLRSVQSASSTAAATVGRICRAHT